MCARDSELAFLSRTLITRSPLPSSFLGHSLRESEFAFLFRSLIKLSPPPPKLRLKHQANAGNFQQSLLCGLEGGLGRGALLLAVELRSVVVYPYAVAGQSCVTAGPPGVLGRAGMRRRQASARWAHLARSSCQLIKFFKYRHVYRLLAYARCDYTDYVMHR